ncbi:bifunctional ADP-dependent NAD(P)H-hydrate dehydratase/NAD(P)H-hydrate epimerase [Legionella jordanis]|uniref:Bifunctional NAD(P)H-hydrate repair enzyme n=1 Tax=Legionella jordanis TaxID=456 RepID=A0A0W0VBL3_9GAMM|nr:bifunctional ADP-dependent NAD(P)H-hydrate dehydratase/NAD(P)H-hydrate epimerase [Legionella jordanis]KTD17531.1 carbohydrate kinase [Legionella jordanis]RMX05132.1 bifunctional ADP-dependent NAD(P)H-hydrate dehydratase/NAD(P)H-hydrate epimerase [Legionella jordanis]RMX17388.1 bifunctional ADP-dependent NAD(P)H-hydrate dehydratase/NAD(P)H-hydrate epimerase [Legionella jordanis]VEH13500.1 carbohydrate kinase [Legionella jordanis]HAT8714417.1 bifunctional ADP-dependent NAD(P)H-hydrate dehydra
MTAAKTPLYQVKQIRSCERMAVSKMHLSETELMERAGKSAFSCMSQLFPKARRLVIFCGGGNNAGDGYVLARLALEKGYSVIVNQYRTVEELPPAAQHAAVQALSAGLYCQALDEPIDSDVDLIVDALLGIGLQGEVRGPIAVAINQINDCDIPVLALDIPSGLNADSGNVMSLCVKATATITFIGNKLGLFTADGPDYCGKVICNSLKLEPCLSHITPAAYLMDKHLPQPILPPRLKNSHKGNYGHVLVIGGGLGMPGSVYLAAKAALRAGAGLVTIATRPEHAGHVLPDLAEAMIYGIEEIEQLSSLIARASVCIIGPGLGEDEWAKAMFAKAIGSQLAMIIDASALRLLAKNHQHDDNWILTPHPGEAACLLNCSTNDVQSDRYQAALAVQKLYGGNVILKGQGTLICTDEAEVYLCSAGNPGMASAGMGDTLNGVIAGLFAQGLSLADAAKYGVWVHAMAGDAAASAFGERGLLASDLMPYVREFVN